MDQHLQLLRQFVNLVRSNTDILHDPKFGFFREFMEEFGAKIPPKKKDTSSGAQHEGQAKEREPEPMDVEEEPPIPYPTDIDNTGVIEADDNSDPLPMGDPNKEASDDDIEKANEARDKAMAAFSEGNMDDALKYFTEAIELNPGLAILHAKRANVLLKLKRPMAAIADCNKAISINADSAQGYKFRGRAYRLLGKWVEAHADLATACKLDYDDVANEWLKEVEPNAKKIQEYNRAVARQAEERELRERRERVRRAQEANRKAQEEAAKSGADGDFGGMRGGDPTGGLGDILGDPEIGEAMKDPEVMAAFMDIMQNPQNLMKHMGNQKVMKLIAKMKDMGGMFGGAGAAPGGCPAGSKCSDTGCGGGSGTGAGAASSAPPPKAPEPDLD
uniref:STI1 domain-containing protein n=1 Tax=Haemonchus contortus TaxID=6289 RepID=A0A7I4YDW0_HAECO